MIRARMCRNWRRLRLERIQVRSLALGKCKIAERARCVLQTNLLQSQMEGLQAQLMLVQAAYERQLAVQEALLAVQQKTSEIALNSATSVRPPDERADEKSAP